MPDSKDAKYKKELEFYRDILKDYLDEVDLLIWLALRDNGRISDTELAKIANVSVPTARRRRMALEEKGIIRVRGFLVFDRLKLSSADVLVKFRPGFSKETVRDFIARALDEPRIYEISEYIGEYDVLLRFFEKDYKTLKEKIEEFLTENGDIVERYTVLANIYTPKIFSELVDENREE
ncbi:Lrp/AsnC family transcriptional regulator [Thermococcus gammatolerans]|uniref:Transcription regulator, putative n=1 Tax=Thermococcus gammatolerans (strain DSM 15229 / JCM 11827 / EJ3) TaxID=593117 RepID=C5A3T0_THEGJ|nr:Lrp/AsnC family transcriptional regulator [Thermococcus gammatolerans]ACS32892.1 Transcription regulator, putative [Thermococcus gammatolerans EJ3]